MEIDLERLHHAYLLVGESQEALSSLHDAFAERGLSLRSSPDFFLYTETLFGIDEARKLSETAVRKAFTGRKIFFISPQKITLEAQNALLKTFEEPIPNTHFFLCVRDEMSVLPTLRSRMQVLRIGHEAEDSEVKKFVGLSIKDRLNFSKKFVEGEKDLPAFLDELLTYLRKTSENLAQVEKVYKARLVSGDRSASPRMILEHLSLVL